MIIKTRLRKQINKKLTNLPLYHKTIPLSEINDILKEHGFQLLQEDLTPFFGFLCGEASHTTFKIGIVGEECSNLVLVLSWYTMPSGNIEINTYLS